MGNQIIKQPDGLFAIFSREQGKIVAWDAAEAEVLDWFAEQSAASTRRNIAMILGFVAASEPERPYGRRVLTWEQALDRDRQSGGEAWRGSLNPASQPSDDEPVVTSNIQESTDA